MKIDLIAGARPNFMKIAPLIHAIQREQHAGVNIQFRLIHTGQHYDKKLSDTFFEQLHIPEPDVNLEAGSGSQAQQTAQIMIRFEEDLIANPCDVVLVVGDVNSTMACSIVAKKLHVDVVHVEAGIRSFDMTMPEEINRLVTDVLCDHFFTTTEIANQNLLRSGAQEGQIHWVGNTMIDTLEHNLHRLVQPHVWHDHHLEEKKYLVVTLHRPANVDRPEKLQAFLEAIIKNAGDTTIIFPIHPRTAKSFEMLTLDAPNLIAIEPLGYHEFIYLVKYAKAVITDSGGIQEETTYLKVPCITLRENTERPETVTIGTNELIGTDPEALTPVMQKLNQGAWKQGAIPQYWDGQTSSRIIKKLLELYG